MALGDPEAASTIPLTRQSTTTAILEREPPGCRSDQSNAGFLQAHKGHKSLTSRAGRPTQPPRDVAGQRESACATLVSVSRHTTTVVESLPP